MDSGRTPPMRRALELAWEAYRAGSFPVGAVLTDADGVTVAEGRNRIGEGEAPPGRMRGTGIAHAEMDVLAQLPMGYYEDHTLHTSLEPCLVCRAAITMAHVGAVNYLASDRLCHGLEQIADNMPPTTPQPRSASSTRGCGRRNDSTSTMRYARSVPSC